MKIFLTNLLLRQIVKTQRETIELHESTVEKFKKVVMVQTETIRLQSETMDTMQKTIWNQRHQIEELKKLLEREPI